MMESSADQPWLTMLVFMPLAGVLAIFLRRLMASRDGDGRVSDDEQAQVDHAAKVTALVVTSVVFLLSVRIFFLFDPSQGGFQLVEDIPWWNEGVRYKLGVDGISVLFVLLTAFITPVCILASWKSVKKRVADYMIAFLVMETLIFGVFCALDLFLFYFFFESSLIPMFLVIGVWGSDGTKMLAGNAMSSRVYAAVKFFLFTLAGSLLLLVAIIWIFVKTGTTDITVLHDFTFPASAQKWLWLAFFASFAVKMPMWPVHTWLPDAHVQAPTAGSVVLAAILLKMGGYGFLRFSLPMFPLASQDFAPLVYVLSVAAIIYTSLVALAQEDMKKLIAYSSVAHMGFVTMGIFTMTVQGIEGALFQMISHGFISGALFLCVGVLYDRMHTRRISFYGGLVKRMPFFAFLFLFFTMCNAGLPGTSGFVGEILTMTGAFMVDTRVAFFAASGVILSAAYALRLYREVVYGELSGPSLQSIPDLDRRELLLLSVLMFFALYTGFNPGAVLSVFGPSVDVLMSGFDAGVTAGGR